jgi:glycosyltransferase involved in cell wall biosynthesis
MTNQYKDIILSICVPTYNRPELLKRTLHSIPESSNVEILVTDNSTDDKSKALVNKLNAGSKRKYQYHKNNFPDTWPGSKLMVENFNMGLKLAKGRYIMFIHDDDFMWNEGLEIIIEYIHKGNYPVYMFGVNLVDAEGKKIKSQYSTTDLYLNPENALHLLLSNSSIVRFPAIVAHRDVYQQIGKFNPLYKGPTDFDMWARIFASFGVYRVSKVITAYTIHDAAQTMKTFNESNIRILLDIFNQVNSWKILSKKQFLHAKSKFFHQFILAGAVRLLKKGEIQEARKIMDLFRIPEIKALNIPVNWLPLRILFSILMFIPVLPLKVRTSLN